MTVEDGTDADSDSDQKAQLEVSVQLPRRTQRHYKAPHTRVSDDLNYCATRAAMPDGSSTLWTPSLLVKMPPHWLVQGTLNPSRGSSQFATIQLQLQIFSSTRGFGAIQIR